MKLSQVIAQAQELLATRGDLPAYVRIDQCGTPVPLTSVAWAALLGNSPTDVALFQHEPQPAP